VHLNICLNSVILLDQSFARKNLSMAQNNGCGGFDLVALSDNRNLYCEEMAQVFLMKWAGVVPQDKLLQAHSAFS